MGKSKFQQTAEARLKRQARKKAQPKQADEATEQTAERKAGTLALDWREITRDDFDKKVEPHLPEVGDAGEQISYLLTLKADCEYECDKITRRIQEAEQRILPPPGIDPDIQSRLYRAEAHYFLERLNRKVEHLRQLRSLERKPSRSADAPDEPTNPDRLSVPRGFWVVHYLLVEAGMDYTSLDKTTVAKFIAAVCGRSYDNVYALVKNKYERGQAKTEEDLAAVRELFEQLKVTRIVERIDNELGYPS